MSKIHFIVHFKNVMATYVHTVEDNNDPLTIDNNLNCLYNQNRFKVKKDPYNYIVLRNDDINYISYAVEE